jgi:hypothetical protein
MKKLLVVAVAAGLAYAIWVRMQESAAERQLWQEVTDDLN